MIVLNVEHLALSFGVKSVLRDVTFALDERDHLGIIGVNGCGKSTLFRLITGEYTPDSGAVYLSKNKTVGILRQDDAFLEWEGENGEASALDMMYRSFPHLLTMEAHLKQLEQQLQSENSSRRQEELSLEFSTQNERFIREGGLEFRSRCASTLMKMGFDEETMRRPLSSFSGGQRTRLALSRELCREPDILMLDEPTNHLDIETLGWLESFLSDYKKCVLVISHDRYFLDRVTGKTLSVENGCAKLYNGNYTTALQKRKAEREIQEKHYKNQQKEIARQEAYIAQQRQWNRERNIIAAESRLKQLSKLERVERPEDAPPSIRMHFSSSQVSGNDVLTVKDLSFSYGSAPLLYRLSFTVKRGDRLFLVGPNGCGKSTLLKLMLGKLTPSHGYAELGYNVHVGYYDQENQNLSPQNTVLDELWNAFPSQTEETVRRALAQFCFFGDDVFKEVSALSGGERARLTLAKLILSDVNLLVLDEPTNHLDTRSREALESALEEFDGTVITVSHDRYLIEKTATRILDLSANGAVDLTVRNRGHAYAELCDDRQFRSTQNKAAPDAVPEAPRALSQKEQYLKNKQESAEARRLQKQLERLRAEAARLEAELEAVEAEMATDAATDYLRLSELDLRKNDLEERLLAIYEKI